jgi:hypothetical protein
MAPWETDERFVMEKLDKIDAHEARITAVEITLARIETKLTLWGSISLLGAPLGALVWWALSHVK